MTVCECLSLVTFARKCARSVLAVRNGSLVFFAIRGTTESKTNAPSMNSWAAQKASAAKSRKPRTQGSVRLWMAASTEAFLLSKAISLTVLKSICRMCWFPHAPRPRRKHNLSY
eukprot:10863878-Lingulodinium_polyedra.AAC.1